MPVISNYKGFPPQASNELPFPELRSSSGCFEFGSIRPGLGPVVSCWAIADWGNYKRFSERLALARRLFSEPW